MFLTSDNGGNAPVFYNNALPTANFQDFNQGKMILEHIKSLSEDFPLAVMEFWSGWFDHWGEEHNSRSPSVILNNLEEILKIGASVSIYMFHGGTNFGFMAGANLDPNYKPDVTSYDYGAPISEAGDITPLYHGMRDLITKYTKVNPPPVPPNREKAAYGNVKMMSFMSWNDLLSTCITKDVRVYKNPLPMEFLNMDEQRSGFGQNYGYIVYRKTVPKFTKLTVKGTIKDRLQLILDSNRDSTVLDWNSLDYTIDVSSHSMMEANINHTLDLLVENLGRVNYVAKGSDEMNQQRKGIVGQILLDDIPVENWTIYPLSFNNRFYNKFRVNVKYQPLSSLAKPPCLFKTDLVIEGLPKDTFLKMTGWGKGTVFINGYHLGRYWATGPQKTLFVPGSYLKDKNTVLVFEEEKRGDYISFLDHPELS